MVPVSIGLGLLRAANCFITAESWVGVGVALNFMGEGGVRKGLGQGYR